MLRKASQGTTKGFAKTIWRWNFSTVSSSNLQARRALTLTSCSGNLQSHQCPNSKNTQSQLDSSTLQRAPCDNPAAAPGFNAHTALLQQRPMAPSSGALRRHQPSNFKAELVPRLPRVLIKTLMNQHAVPENAIVLLIDCSGCPFHRLWPLFLFWGWLAAGHAGRGRAPKTRTLSVLKSTRPRDFQGQWQHLRHYMGKKKRSVSTRQKKMCHKCGGKICIHIRVSNVVTDLY